MNEVEKMNEAMYERLCEIAKFASNKRVELDPDFKGGRPEDAQNRLMLAAFRELRQMCEFYKPSEEPVVPGCPSPMPRQLPGGFDGVGPENTNLTDSTNKTNPSNPLNPSNPCLKVSEKARSKIKACNDRSHERVVEIAKLANECLLNTDHPNGYEPGQYGQDYRTFGKAIAQMRKLVRESIADVAPDYEMLALQFARNSFDFAKFQEALAAVASMKAEDFPGVYYTPGWLCELAKKLEANGDDKALTTEEQSARDREIARQKRKIHWTCYPTKVDLCAMGRTEQNGKVYEVRIAKRGDSKVQDTYGQCKVNGKTVITCSFTGNAWMLKRILTAGMQALVNYKAKKKRDSRRNYKRRDAAAKAAGEVK